MYSVAHVANTLLVKAQESNSTLTPMKLQKLLYLLYKEYLKRTKQPLFPERFEPWRYGPVIGDIYQAFKKYGSGPIKGYYEDVDGKSYYLNVSVDGELKRAVEKVWDKYSGFDGIKLSRLTHFADGAWQDAYKNNRKLLEDNAIMSEPEFITTRCES